MGYHGQDRPSSDQSAISQGVKEIDESLNDLSVVDLEGDEDPGTIIGHMMTKPSGVKSESPYNKQQDEMLKRLGHNHYVYLNHGACGTIFYAPGTNKVLKVARDHKHAVDLWNDYKMHTSMCETFGKYAGQIDVRIPQVDSYVQEDNEWWEQHADRMPPDHHNGRQAVLISERIIQVPLVFREALINHYVREDKREQNLETVKTTPTLVRLYFGKQKNRPGKLSLVNLRNFVLYADQMDEIPVDLTPYVLSLAKALAIMHWDVKCDARDVEFVLGAQPIDTRSIKEPTPLSAKEIRAFSRPTHTAHRLLKDQKHRTIHFWLLDFNQVRDMEMSQAGVEQAREAFFVNDPYYPRPGGKHWEVFERAYLRASKKIFRHEEAELELDEKLEARVLPQAFIDAVKEEEARRQASRTS